VVDAEGEWEAFYFAHWVPGVDRYPSFRALMERERTGWSAPAPSHPAPLNKWWGILRWIFRSS